MSTATRVALVTGASSGIGRSLAQELANRGWRLVLVARRDEPLRAIAEELPGTGHEVLAADLSSAEGTAEVVARIAADAAPVHLLVHAAGMGTTAPFPDAPLAEEEAMLNLNVLSTLRLSHAAAIAMRTRGDGAILLVSSTAAYWSAGTYAASKAWVLATGLGLRSRLSETGVGVTVLVPGFTRTEFHARSSTDASGVQPWLWLDPREVAREAVDAVEANRGVCIPGRRYRALVESVRHLPPGGRSAVLRRIAPLGPKRS